MALPLTIAIAGSPQPRWCCDERDSSHPAWCDATVGDAFANTVSGYLTTSLLGTVSAVARC